MYLLIKRLLDICFSFTCLFLLLPLFVALVIAVKLDSKGPIFFVQTRVGRNKRQFTIVKFRTMAIDAPHEVPTHLLENPNKWPTRVGRFLRRTSLDELPQVWNVLVGQMSFVGPRPALWNQDDLIAERDKYGANRIRPGLTGLAQISGRDELSIAAKAKLDGDYARKISFTVDLKCFFGTFLAILRGEGMGKSEGRKE